MHTNLINNKKYIGQTINTCNKRWANGKGYISCPKFYNAILKYGWENFSHIILECGLESEQLDNREKYWIQYYNTIGDNGYNVDKGGSKHHFSEEHKQKIKQGIVASKGRKVICLNNHKIYSTIAEAQKDTGANHIYDCCCHKLQTSGSDKKGYGLVWRFIEDYSENEKIQLKLQSKYKYKVICKNTGIIYNSISEASRLTNVDNSSISRCCNHKRKSAGKTLNGEPIIWEFYEEDDNG